MATSQHDHGSLADGRTEPCYFHILWDHELDEVRQLLERVAERRDEVMKRWHDLRTYAAAEKLAALFRDVAARIDLRLEVALTDARAPIGRGIGPRLEALDVLAVLRGNADAPQDLREKSLYIASRILEMSGKVAPGAGYREARRMLDSGAAMRKFTDIVNAQGARELPPEAPFHHVIAAQADGRIREIDCWEIARVAKRAGAPANVAAGVRMLKTIGDVLTKDEPLFEIHASSAEQLDTARSYAVSRPGIITLGF